MSDIQQVCDALADAVRHVERLKAKGYVDTTIAPPEAQVYTRPFDPRLVFAPSPVQYELGLRVFVKGSDLKASQAALRAYMEPTGSTSVRAALEDAANWPHDVHLVEVTQIGQPAEIELADNKYWFVDFDVTVVW
jgi:hypothetical protein